LGTNNEIGHFVDAPSVINPSSRQMLMTPLYFRPVAKVLVKWIHIVDGSVKRYGRDSVVWKFDAEKLSTVILLRFAILPS
jgi:hypothetical protein